MIAGWGMDPFTSENKVEILGLDNLLGGSIWKDVSCLLSKLPAMAECLEGRAWGISWR